MMYINSVAAANRDSCPRAGGGRGFGARGGDGRGAVEGQAEFGRAPEPRELEKWSLRRSMTLNTRTTDLENKKAGE